MASFKNVAQVLQTLGFEPMGGGCAGAWRGYAVSCMMVNYSQIQFEFAVRLDRKNREPARAAVQALKSAGLRATVVNKGSTVAFMTNFNKKTPLEQQVFLFLETAASALAGSGVFPAATCAVCGGSAPESLGFCKGSYQPVHAGCLQNQVSAAKEKAEDNRLGGSYLTGFLGALLGVIVGMIPNLLTIVFLDYVVAVLFALVPLAAMWGYRKLGGKDDAASIVIVVVLSLASALLMTAISAAADLSREYSARITETLPAIFSYVVTAEGLMALLQDSIVPLIFMVLGLWIAWRFLRQTNAVNVQNAEAAVQTLRRNPSYMARAGAPEQTSANSEVS